MKIVNNIKSVEWRLQRHSAKRSLQAKKMKHRDKMKQPTAQIAHLFFCQHTGKHKKTKELFFANAWVK
jgi:hypothetical protein